MRKCLVCNKESGEGAALFHFPKCRNRAKAWISALEFDVSLLPAVSLDNLKICSDHFEDWCFTSTEKKRLIFSAMPNNMEPPNKIAKRSFFHVQEDQNHSSSSTSHGKIRNTARKSTRSMPVKKQASTVAPLTGFSTDIKSSPAIDEIEIVQNGNLESQKEKNGLSHLTSHVKIKNTARKSASSASAKKEVVCTDSSRLKAT